jgi:ATP-dependent Clp protease ATP-binding subunit ClpA
MYENLFPKWAREIERYLPMKSFFFVYKNIYDIFLFPQKTLTRHLPGSQAQASGLKQMVDQSPDRYSYSPENEALRLQGYMLHSELVSLRTLFAGNTQLLTSIESLYADSRNFRDVTDLAELDWLNFNLNSYLHNLLIMNGYAVVAYYDLVDGFTFPMNNRLMKDTFMQLVRAKEEAVDVAKVEQAAVKNDESKSRLNQVQLKAKIDDALDMMRRALTNREIPVAIIMKYSSRILSSPTSLTPDENKNFVRLLKINEEAAKTFVAGTQRRNLMFLVSEKLNDLPPWLYLNNPQAKALQIDLPDVYERKRFFNIMRENFHGGETLITGPEIEKIRNLFTDLSSGMTNIDLENIRSISLSEKVNITEMKNIIQRYKYGIIESEWDKIEKEKLANAAEILRRRVKGQDEAVRHTLDVIKRAKVGLSGVQSGSSNRPRGVLFFAGPTGVGKTELAKAMAEFLFGDEKRCIRFDMSEYSQEHSDQKLLGAPPGYVGYEEGGQLTNAVKENPFSVILFDEIEKAHPRILDKFLQILDDGRMTDGKGETVYFSEAMIIFTSNLGTYVPDENGRMVQNTSPKMEYSEVKQKILESIRHYFEYGLKRPELLNRLGENFIVFDYVRPEIAGQIIRKIMDGFTNHLLQEKQIIVQIAEPVITFIQKRSFENLQFGGRGIGNVIEKFIINPFSRWLFDSEISNGSRVVMNDVIYDESQDLVTLNINKA